MLSSQTTMPSLSLSALCFLLLHPISALPLSTHKYPKRSTPHSVGTSVAIALCIVLVAALSYSLGTRHALVTAWIRARRTRTNTRSHPRIPDPRRHARQISAPLKVESSAPIKPWLHEGETPASARIAYEMHAEQIHELGLPSPRKPPSRTSWMSFERRPWWLGYAGGRGGCIDEKERERSVHVCWFQAGRERNGSIDSSGGVQGNGSGGGCRASRHGASTTSTGAMHVEMRAGGEEGRMSRGSSLAGWSGLEFVRRIYVERKSRVETL